MPLDPTTLRSRIGVFLEGQRISRRWNRRLNALLVVSGLLVAAAAIISGILDCGKTGACLGIVVGAIFSLDGAFAFGQIAEFRESIIAEAEDLIEKIDDDTSGGQLKGLALKYRKLKMEAVRSAPVGSKMGAIIAFAEQYSRARATPTPHEIPAAGKSKRKTKAKRRSKVPKSATEPATEDEA